MRMLYKIIVVAALSVSSQAATHHVPADFPSIQGAIDSPKVVGGDVVLVSAGTYVELINFKGKAITVKGEEGPRSTVIEGSSFGVVVMFNSGEGPDSVIEGFTITNGYGGGIYCWETSPTIRRNIIHDNVVAIGGSGGGGISCYKSDAKIVNNLIHENAGYDGGGISCFKSSPLIVNNTITENDAIDLGGGIYCQESSPIIRNSILWGDEDSMGPFEIFIHSGSPIVEYCNVAGRGRGGNLNIDPGFDTDYRLTRHSPCINRGTDTGAPPDDLDGDPRPTVGSTDMGADEYTGVHDLDADTFTLPVTGGSVHFALDAEAHNGSRWYLLLGSVTGTIPGHPLPQNLATLPVMWDPFTDLVLLLLNSPVFQGFLGKMDVNGTASATLSSPALPPAAVGVCMHYAYALNNPFDFVSNPVPVEIVP